MRKMNNRKEAAGHTWPALFVYMLIFCLIASLFSGCTPKPEEAGSSSQQSQAAGTSGESKAEEQSQAETANAETSVEEAESTAAEEGSEEAAQESEAEPEAELFGYGLFGGNPYEGSGLAEITPEEEAAIRTMIAEMSVEEKVGQMFMARFPGATTDGPESSAQAEEDARTCHLGGYVLFAPDFKVKDETIILDKLDAVQAAADIPLLLSVDEEGGNVTRVSQYFRDTAFLAPRNAYDWAGAGTLISEIYERCEILGDLHLNMNLYPVCDISDNPADFIYYRAFSGDPDTAADYVAEVVKLMKTYQIACSLKHFPGYGNNADTHTDLVVDERPAETFYEADFKPFMAGIAQGAQTVMVSHNIVQCFDADNPSSLSPEVHRILREDLGFEGVIMTDDLGMEGVKKYSDEDVAIMAVLAGNDMLISSDYKLQIEAVLQAVADGTITEERLDESVYRILRMKVSMGLITVNE